jgi:hypothetical protein
MKCLAVLQLYVYAYKCLAVLQLYVYAYKCLDSKTFVRVAIQMNGEQNICSCSHINVF